MNNNNEELNKITLCLLKKYKNIFNIEKYNIVENIIKEHLNINFDNYTDTNEISLDKFILKTAKINDNTVDRKKNVKFYTPFDLTNFMINKMIKFDNHE